MFDVAKIELDAPAEDAGARPRGRPRAADREPLILSATSELLAEVGYDQLRVQDVAERAGVGLATIYRRWATKQDLVIAAMHEEKTSVEMPETDDPRADLELILREMANELAGPKSCLLIGFVSALRTDPELGRAFRESLLSVMRDRMRRPIARVIGEDAPDLDVRADLAPALLMFRTLVDDRPADPDELARQLCALVLAPAST